MLLAELLDEPDPLTFQCEKNWLAKIPVGIYLTVWETHEHMREACRYRTSSTKKETLRGRKWSHSKLERILVHFKKFEKDFISHTDIKKAPTFLNKLKRFPKVSCKSTKLLKKNPRCSVGFLNGFVPIQDIRKDFWIRAKN